MYHTTAADLSAHFLADKNTLSVSTIYPYNLYYMYRILICYHTITTDLSADLCY